jgi:hypothetical protein
LLSESVKNSLGCGDWAVNTGDLWVVTLKLRTDAESAEGAEKSKTGGEGYRFLIIAKG